MNEKVNKQYKYVSENIPPFINVIWLFYMKTQIECLLCILERGIRAVRELHKVNSEDLLRISKALLKMLYEKFNFNVVPSFIGTEREKMLQRLLNIPDLYARLKQESNRVAKKIAEKIYKNINLSDKSFNTFRKVLLLSAVANSMEWFIRGREFSIEQFDEEISLVERNLSIDDTPSLMEDISNAQTLLYVLDNAGEAVFDLYTVKYLRNFVPNIIVAARARPVLNDITVGEAIELGFKAVSSEVVPVGWFIGVFLDHKDVNPYFLKIFDQADVVIAKGMGAYESLSEYKFTKPVYVILKTKCWPVANSLGVAKDSLVIKKL